jgi:hypothetical protein
VFPTIKKGVIDMRLQGIAAAALLLMGSYASACYDCAAVLQTYEVPVAYRTVQPTVIRETLQLERHTYEREPLIVERQEKVVQYLLPLNVLPVYAAALKVQKVQVQHVQQVQKVYSPTVIQQNTVQRGLFGRIRRSNSTTIINP